MLAGVMRKTNEWDSC